MAQYAKQSTEILLDRYNSLIKLKPEDFQINKKYNLWVENFESGKTLEHIFRHVHYR